MDINGLLSNNGEILGYNYFQTFWTKGVSDEIKILNLKERVFGEFRLGPGQTQHA